MLDQAIILDSKLEQVIREGAAMETSQIAQIEHHQKSETCFVTKLLAIKQTRRAG